MSQLTEASTTLQHAKKHAFDVVRDVRSVVWDVRNVLRNMAHLGTWQTILVAAYQKLSTGAIDDREYVVSFSRQRPDPKAPAKSPCRTNKSSAWPHHSRTILMRGNT